MVRMDRISTLSRDLDNLGLTAVPAIRGEMVMISSWISAVTFLSADQYLLAADLVEMEAKGAKAGEFVPNRRVTQEMEAMEETAAEGATAAL